MKYDTPSAIGAQVVHVSSWQARDWFLSLKDHPERYRFATHDGIAFVQGNFGEVGARFKTREKFYCLKLNLLFELIEISGNSFRFRLARPAWLSIWGAFEVRESSQRSVILRLEIGATDRWGRWGLRLWPVAAAIRRQITQEVAHIKASMEAYACAEGGSE